MKNIEIYWDGKWYLVPLANAKFDERGSKQFEFVEYRIPVSGDYYIYKLSINELISGIIRAPKITYCVKTRKDTDFCSQGRFILQEIP